MLLREKNKFLLRFLFVKTCFRVENRDVNLIAKRGIDILGGYKEKPLNVPYTILDKTGWDNAGFCRCHNLILFSSPHRSKTLPTPLPPCSMLFQRIARTAGLISSGQQHWGEGGKGEFWGLLAISCVSLWAKCWTVSRVLSKIVYDAFSSFLKKCLEDLAHF